MDDLLVMFGVPTFASLVLNFGFDAPGYVTFATFMIILIQLMAADLIIKSRR